MDESMLALHGEEEEQGCACQFYANCTKKFWSKAVENWVRVEKIDESWTKKCAECGGNCLRSCFLSSRCALQTSYVAKLLECLAKDRVKDFASQPILAPGCLDNMLPLEYAIRHKYPAEVVLPLMHSFPAAIKSYSEGGNVVPLYCLAATHRQSEDVLLCMLQEYPEAAVDDAVPPWFDVLRVAVKEKHERIVLCLLQMHPHLVKSRNASFDGSALHDAIEFDHSQNTILSLLDLWNGAAAVTNVDGLLPLRLALNKKLPDCVVLAILKANPEAATITTPDELLPLHDAMTDKLASTAVLSALLEANPDAAKVSNSKGSLPIHTAIQKKCKDEVLPILIAANIDALGAKDKRGRLPLVMAIEAKKFGVQALLDLFVLHKDAASIMDSEGRFPLRLALKHGAPSEFVLALVRAYPDAVKSPGKTKVLDLHKAVKGGYSVEVIDEIAKAYPEALTKKLKNGKIPLQIALDHKLPGEVILALLQAGDAQSQASSRFNDRQDMPLHRAIRFSYAPSVLLALLDAYPSAVMIKNSMGRLPLHVAAVGGSTCTPDVLKRLIEEYPRALEEQGNGGNVPRDLVQPKLPPESMILLCNSKPEHYAPKLAIKQLAKQTKSVGAVMDESRVELAPKLLDGKSVDPLQGSRVVVATHADLVPVGEQCCLQNTPESHSCVDVDGEADESGVEAMPPSDSDGEEMVAQFHASAFLNKIEQALGLENIDQVPRERKRVDTVDAGIQTECKQLIEASESSGINGVVDNQWGVLVEKGVDCADATNDSTAESEMDCDSWDLVD